MFFQSENGRPRGRLLCRLTAFGLAVCLAMDNAPRTLGEEPVAEADEDAHHRSNASCLDEDYGPLVDLQQEFEQIRNGEHRSSFVRDYQVDSWEAKRVACIEAFNGGEYERAIEVAASLREEAESTFGDQHLAYAIATEIGAKIKDIVDEVRIGQSKEYRIAGKIYLRQYGEDHPTPIACLASMGKNLAQESSIDQGIKTLRFARVVQEQYYGAPHFKTAQTLYGLAYAYEMADRTQEALELVRQSVEVFAETNSTETVEYAEALALQSLLLTRSGRHDEALSTLDRSDEILNRVTHTKDPRRTTARLIRGLVHKRTGTNDERAYEYFTELIGDIEDQYGRESARFLDTLGVLCGLAEDVGNLEEARQHHERLCELTRRVEKGGALRYAHAVFNFAMYCNRDKDLDEAERLLKKVLDVTENESEYRRHPLHAATVAALGAISVRKGDLATGELLLLESRELTMRISGKQGSGHWFVAEALGRLRLKQGREAEGLRLLEEAIESLEAYHGATHPEVVELRAFRDAEAARVASRDESKP
ncbi:MAG: tetratricopeptide repeat protein [Planctomycetota bacterium]|nr:MAG: tetratricopeptide repeat protein [Planctomycetota bacterium]